MYIIEHFRVSVYEIGETDILCTLSKKVCDITRSITGDKICQWKHYWVW